MYKPRCATRAGLVLIGSVLSFLLVGCVVASPGTARVLPTATPGATAVAMPTLTPIPGIKATLTALPKQPPLSADQARPYEGLRAAVERCNAYNENRKLGILSQIDYVLQPSTAPSDFVVLVRR